MSAVDFFASERFNHLRELGLSESWTEVAAEYRKVTGEDVKSSVIAAEVLKAVLRYDGADKDTDSQ
ncbi:hypothetical protein MTQ17_09905 [Corynebacterium bovis]|uniref:hypothetical protein n=1 Tax=Corynebacterium bovis TaxID=36808 RepID=UPI003138C384